MLPKKKGAKTDTTGEGRAGELCQPVGTWTNRQGLPNVMTNLKAEFIQRAVVLHRPETFLCFLTVKYIHFKTFSAKPVFITLPVIYLQESYYKTEHSQGKRVLRKHI